MGGGRLFFAPTIVSIQMAMLTSRCSATTTAIHTLGTVIPTGMKASLPHAAQPSGRHQCVGLRSASSQTEEPDGLQFGKIPIPERHVFFRSEDKLSAAFVNLRPIVPGLSILRSASEEL